MLTQDQVHKFEEEGFLIIPEFASIGEIKELIAATEALVEKFNPAKHPLTRFSTGGDVKEHVGDDYFLDSGDKIRYFLEQEAVGQDKQLKVPPNKAINKIGHALHRLDPTFRKFSLSDRVKSVARSIGFESPAILQSMVIFKQPRIGGAVPPHQDSSFLFTKPLSATGLWLAMEDCTPENGCLSFFSGSHKEFPISRRFVRKIDPETGLLEGTKFIGEEYGSEIYNKDQYKPALIPAGTLVLIHGSILHKSEPNHSERSRLAYTFHMIESQAEYPKDNWLQPTPGVPFDILY